MDLMNPNTLATFRELMEPEELREFLDRVIQEMLNADALLKQLHMAGDWKALQKLVHRLKGSLGSVGCDALYEMLQKIDAQLQATPAHLPTNEEMAQVSAVFTSSVQRLRDL